MCGINIILLLILAPLAIISQSVSFPKASNATIKALLNIGDKKEMDVIIAVESSKSPNANTVCSLEALQNIVYLIDAKLPLSRTGSNIGIIKYGELATIFLNIKTGYRVPAVFSVLRNMKPFGGNISRLDLAIAMAQRMFIGGGRISAVKKLIILTSRPPAKDPVPSAKLIKTISYLPFHYI